MSSILNKHLANSIFNFINIFEGSLLKMFVTSLFVIICGVITHLEDFCIA